MRVALKHPEVSLVVAEGIARITLNREKVHNAFNETLISVITAAFQWVTN